MSSPSTSVVASDRLRLGDLASGPIATGGTGGVVTLNGHGDVRWSWWVGAEDRWHRPESEITTADRHLPGAAGLETIVRLPSGDFVGSAAGARLDALGGSGVLWELENRSPVPVAVAFVVETTRPVRVLTDGLAVEGVGSLRLTRPAAGVVAAPDARSLLDALGSNERPGVEVGATFTGAVAVLIPLPHGAHAIAAVVAGDRAAATTFDRATAPRIEAISRGWSAHLSSSPSWSSGLHRRDTVLREAMADLLIGPTWERENAADVAAIAEALARIGRIDLSAPLEALLEDQRSNGSLDAPDPVAATAAFMRAIGATWASGAAPEAGERLLEAAALAGHYLDKRRNRAAVAADATNVSFAYESVIGLAEDLGEVSIAERFRRRCLELGVGSPLCGPRADEWVAGLGAGLCFGSADGEPSVAASARFVIRAASELVAERAEGVDLHAGWSGSLAGLEIDVEQVPTRWGILSWSLRWHGRRPAILWELVAWSRRTAARPFALTCSAIDPTFQFTEPSGETLLPEPADAEWEGPQEFVPDHLLSTSSEGHKHGIWSEAPDFGDRGELPEEGTFS